MDSRKGASWSVDEVQTFLCLVADERIQRELDGTVRNERVFREIAQSLAAHGYQRTSHQCRVKLKKLRCVYRAIKDHNSRNGSYRKGWKWFNQIDAIYGHRPASNGSEGGLESVTALLERMTEDGSQVALEPIPVVIEQEAEIQPREVASPTQHTVHRPSKRRRRDDEMLRYIEYMERSEQRLLQQHTDICARLDNMEVDRKVLLGLIERMVTVMEDQAKK